MRHPSEYYVKYLLAASWGDEENILDATVVSETLKDLNLPPIDEEEFDRLRGIFDPPENYRFNSTSHQETVEFMKREKIFSYWNSNGDMRRVMLEMVGSDNRLLQHRIHILLMGFVPSGVIAEKVSRYYHLKDSITASMVEHYRHYFWRVQNLTEREWMEFLVGDPHFDQYIAALKCGDQQALFRAGFNPKYDYKLGLRDTHRQVTYRIQYLAHQQDDKRTVDLLIKLSREQRALYDILYGEGGGFEEQVREIRHFMMEHKIPDVKTLEGLLGPKGTYSGDGTEGQPSVKEAAQKATQKVGRKPAVVKPKKKGDQ